MSSKESRSRKYWHRWTKHSPTLLLVYTFFHHMWSSNVRVGLVHVERTGVKTRNKNGVARWNLTTTPKKCLTDDFARHWRDENHHLPIIHRKTWKKRSPSAFLTKTPLDH